MTWYENASAPWIPVSRSLIKARTLVLWIWTAPPVIVSAVLALVFDLPWLLIIPGVLLALGLWATWLIPRQVAVHAWAEADEDLLIRRGRLMRSVTVVPYGRMQFVDVSAGPISRMCGIATVQLHTASSSTDASISGVPTQEAGLLRDRLTARGEARLTGL